MARRRAAEAVDLYDYVPRVRSTPRARPRPALTSDEERVIHIQDDWPDVVPISEAELRVVEGHLGDVLDELFGPKP